MRSPALTIGWALWRRHRRGLSALLAWLAGVSVLYRALPAGDLAWLAGAACVPFAAAIPYLLAAFSFGFEADVAARASGYPRRMFTLPVRTATLVAWPMLYGAAVVACTWLVLARFVLW